MSDDFWTTHISVSPEEDKDFAPKSPRGCWAWAIAVLGLLGWVLFYLLV